MLSPGGRQFGREAKVIKTLREEGFQNRQIGFLNPKISMRELLQITSHLGGVRQSEKSFVLSKLLVFLS
jgi:hypothetical protein